jgi:hypothetical protein
VSGQWKKLSDTLIENRNGNWVWKTGESEYEVWLGKQFAGIAQSKDVAMKIAADDMREVLRSGVVFQTLDRWLERHESQ